MRKIFVLFLLLVGFISINKTIAAPMSFSEGYSQTSRKPLAVLVYATWADNYVGHVRNFRRLQNEVGNQFNYVELDIASPQAKAYNDRYEIFPKLPYIILFRNNGRVSRLIQRDCASDTSCVKTKMKAFIL